MRDKDILSKLDAILKIFLLYFYHAHDVNLWEKSFYEKQASLSGCSMTWE